MTGIEGIDILKDRVKYIKEHPEEHKQDNWACGTAFCVAGHIDTTEGAVLPGPAFIMRWKQYNCDSIEEWMDEYQFSNETDEQARARGMMIIPQVYSSMRWPDGTERQIDLEATRILGIDQDTADMLFAGRNTIEDIESMTKYLETHDNLNEWMYEAFEEECD